jgi:hypothetical protein
MPEERIASVTASFSSTHGMTEASFDPSHASVAGCRASFQPSRRPKNFCANRRIRACAARNPRLLRQLFFRLGLAAPAVQERAQKIPREGDRTKFRGIAIKKTPKFIGVSKNTFARARFRRIAKGESRSVLGALLGCAGGTAAQKKFRKTVDTLKKRD